jgi:hypothetical protein
VEGRYLAELAFDAGLVRTDAGALFLEATDRAIGLVDRFANRFRDRHPTDSTKRRVATLVRRRLV